MTKKELQESILKDLQKAQRSALRMRAKFLDSRKRVVVLEKALQDILDCFPPNPKLPLSLEIIEIARKALSDDLRRD